MQSKSKIVVKLEIRKFSKVTPKMKIKTNIMAKKLTIRLGNNLPFILKKKLKIKSKVEINTKALLSRTKRQRINGMNIPK